MKVKYKGQDKLDRQPFYEDLFPYVKVKYKGQDKLDRQPFYEDPFSYVKVNGAEPFPKRYTIGCWVAVIGWIIAVAMVGLILAGVVTFGIGLAFY